MSDWKNAAKDIEAFYADIEQLELQGKFTVSSLSYPTYAIDRMEEVKRIIARHAPNVEKKIKNLREMGERSSFKSYKQSQEIDKLNKENWRLIERI